MGGRDALFRRILPARPTVGKESVVRKGLIDGSNFRFSAICVQEPPIGGETDCSNRGIPWAGMRPVSTQTAVLTWIGAVLMSCATAAEAVETGPLPDVTLQDIFSDGWTDSWVKRFRPEGAPDLTLLRVQSNLLLRSLRTDGFIEQPASSGDSRVSSVTPLVEYAVNRRLMPGFFVNYQEIDHASGGGLEGWTYGGLVRLQLVDTANTSYAFNLKMTAPNSGLGDRQTLTSFALAGWHNLRPLGLGRMGLYWHLQEETLLGHRVPGTRQNDLTYDISLAQTWTGAGETFGLLTTFAETYAKTDLDGHHSGRTVVTLTPGVRTTLAHHHVVMFGVDFPLNDPKPYDQLYRLTYIYSF